MRLSIEQRRLTVQFVRAGMHINFVAKLFQTSRQTISYWTKQDLRTAKDVPHFRKSKITVEVEASILYMRCTFKWGSARIQQGLMNLPNFMLDEMEYKIQEFSLSRTSINNIFQKHKLNGYRRQKKSWKFFRAKKPNELWQVDLKEFKLNGRKYYIYVVVDDYSRYIIQLKLFSYCPTTRDLILAMRKLKIMPEKILSDNGAQFKKQWASDLLEMKVEAIFAHPYYPQDKGKVERSIRNLAEEFVNLLKYFNHWLGKMELWRIWHNKKRFHRGIRGFPEEVYVKL